MLIYDWLNVYRGDVMDIDLVKRTLLKGEAVVDGNQNIFTIDDVIRECRDLETLLIEINSTDDILGVAKDIRLELSLAAGRVAAEIGDTYDQ